MQDQPQQTADSALADTPLTVRSLCRALAFYAVYERSWVNESPEEAAERIARVFELFATGTLGKPAPVLSSLHLMRLLDSPDVQEKLAGVIRNRRARHAWGWL